MIKKYLLALVAVLASATGVAAQELPELYLRSVKYGTDWPANNETIMTPATDSKGNVIYTKHVPSLTKSDAFKIADANWGTDNYGGGDKDGQANGQMELGIGYQCVPGGTNMQLNSDVYDATVIFNYTTKRIIVAAKTTIPSSLYILGYAADDTGKVHGWTADKGIQMTAMANNVFEARNVLFGDFKDAEGKYTKTSYFSFSEKLGNAADDWNGLGMRFGATGQDLPVELATSMMITKAGSPYSFSIAPGLYDVRVDFGNFVMVVTKADPADVSTLGELAASTEKYVDFTGTVFCEFNYLNDDGTCTLYMSHNDASAGEQLVFTPSYSNVEASFMQPAKFNRGQTLTDFKVMKNSGIYTITGFTLNEWDLPQTTLATERSVEIPEIIQSTNLDNYINRLVQVRGYIDTQDAQNMTFRFEGDNITDFTLTAPFTNKPAVKQSSSDGKWQYGDPLPNPTIKDQMGYVAGILGKDGDRYTLAMTAISIGNDPITGVETTEIDAETIVDVYNMQGMVVRRAVKYGEALRDLPAGLYIVAGKKMIVR